MKQSRFALVYAAMVAVTAAALPAAAGGAATTACANPDLPRAILDGDPALGAHSELRTIKIAAPSATLELAVVDTEAQRELGLMCVTALRQNAGMIFVFARAGTWEFWMKKTLVPLDMIWVDGDGRVTSVAASVPASRVDETDDKVARRSGRGRYVVELRAGEAARAGISAGERLVLPELTASE
jgi:uncharacterized protein